MTRIGLCLLLLGVAGFLPAQTPPGPGPGGGSVVVTVTQPPQPGGEFSVVVQLLGGEKGAAILVELNGVPIPATVTPGPGPNSVTVTCTLPTAAQDGTLSLTVQPAGGSGVSTHDFPVGP